MSANGLEEVRSTAGEGRRAPYVVGLGGTTREDSSTERALAAALGAAASAGATTVLLGAAELDLPLYAPERPERDPRAVRLVDEIRRADGVIVASPGYHGSMSGLVKNALDYLEDLRADERPYLDGRSVGCIVCAYGWQAGVTTLQAMRATVHALRGWPTPLGVTINSAEPVFGPDGAVVDREAAGRLAMLGEQVAGFAHVHRTVAAR
jgi:FMN reductase